MLTSLFRALSSAGASTSCAYRRLRRSPSGMNTDDGFASSAALSLRDDGFRRSRIRHCAEAWWMAPSRWAQPAQCASVDGCPAILGWFDVGRKVWYGLTVSCDLSRSRCLQVLILWFDGLLDFDHPYDGLLQKPNLLTASLKTRCAGQDEQTSSTQLSVFLALLLVRRKTNWEKAHARSACDRRSTSVSEADSSFSRFTSSLPAGDTR